MSSAEDPIPRSRMLRTGYTFARKLVLVATLLVVPSTLYGHAYLTGSDPRADTTLESAPARVTVVFAETIEPAGSRIRILDAAGNPVATGESVVDPQSPRRLSVSIEEELEDGTYTVLWRNVSARDGHPLRDYFLFAVGEPIDAAAVAPGAGESTVASPFAAIGRWLALLGIAAIVGGFFFHLAVVDPVLRTGGPWGSVASDLERRRWTLAWGGVILFLVGSMGELIGQGRIMEASLGLVLAETTWGTNWLLRIGIWGALAVVTAIGARLSRTYGKSSSGSYDGGASSAEPVALLAGAVALFALALTSHVGVGTGVRPPAVLNHFLHQLSASVWMGSLLYLVALVPALLSRLNAEELSSVLPPVIRRFWALAVTCVIALIITGLYNTWIQVTVPEAAATAYGETLIVKVVLVVILFATAGADLLYVRPKIGKPGSAPRLFGRVVRGETAIAALILLTVGFLAGTEPARLAADRLGLLAPDRETVFAAEDEGTRVTMSVEPAVVGRNRLIFDLEDSVGNPVTPESVTVRVSDVPDQTVEVERSPAEIGAGRFVAERVALTTPGTWSADIAVIRPDAFDARVTFEFRVAEQPVETADLLTTGVAWSVFAGEALFILFMVWVARLLGSVQRRSSDAT